MDMLTEISKLVAQFSFTDEQNKKLEEELKLNLATYFTVTVSTEDRYPFYCTISVQANYTKINELMAKLNRPS